MLCVVEVDRSEVRSRRTMAIDPAVTVLYSSLSQDLVFFSESVEDEVGGSRWPLRKKPIHTLTIRCFDPKAQTTGLDEPSAVLMNGCNRGAQVRFAARSGARFMLQVAFVPH